MVAVLGYRSTAYRIFGELIEAGLLERDQDRHVRVGWRLWALLWHRAIGMLELVTMLALYCAMGLGVTVGFHRMVTHHSFDSSRASRVVIGVLGSMAVEGPAITWAADHRNHYAFLRRRRRPALTAPRRRWSAWRDQGLWHGIVWSVVRISPERQARRLRTAVANAADTSVG